jgi:hypothetical protein
MDKTTHKKIYLTLLTTISLTVLLFVLSLTQNAYYINDGEESIGALGLIALLLGFFGISSGSGIAWFANPCLFMSFIHLKRDNLRKAKIFSFISVIFGLSFLFFDNVISNEGGTTAEITSYGIGYWLWLSSLICNFLGILNTERLIKTTANSGL